MARNNTDPGTAKLTVGDATLTRRILKRCREGGFEVQDKGEVVRIGRGRWGFRCDAYIVPSDIYEEEVARRSAEEEKERLVRQEQERVWQEQQIVELKAKFPKLDAAVISLAVDKDESLFLADEVGYQFGRGTKSYWNQLGYRVEGEAYGFVVRGSRMHPVYPTYSLVEKRSQVTVEQLLETWRRRYGSDEIVLVEVLRFANRLQKVKKLTEFYPLKDTWIKRNQCNLIEGRVARHEERTFFAGCINGIIK